MRATHLCVLGLALTALACSSGERVTRAPATDSAFTPTQYSVADFYSNVEYTGASFSPDGSRILVSSNRSGVYNAYAIPTAGGDAQPLTTSTGNSIFAVSWFPADERILYTSDQGGNELDHLYVRTPDGKTRDLTPGAKLKAFFGGWSGDDRSFFVWTNQRDQRFFDLYELATDGYARKPFYRNTEGYTPGAVSRDKRYVALSRQNTNKDADVFLYDRQSGATTLITTAHRRHQLHAPGLLPGREPAAGHLGQRPGVRRAPGATSWRAGGSPRCTPRTGTSPGPSYSRGGKYLIVRVNEDARSTVRMLDAGTLRPVPFAGMPAGVVGGVDLSPRRCDDRVLRQRRERPVRPLRRPAGPAPEAADQRPQPPDPPSRPGGAPGGAIQVLRRLSIPGLLYQPHQASPRPGRRRS